MQKIRKRNKTVFTATHIPAKYIGNHPHLVGTTGVHYFSLDQNCEIYRPNVEEDVGKSDWYRIPNKTASLEDLPTETNLSA